jgi:hypothetical protein
MEATACPRRMTKKCASSSRPGASYPRRYSTKDTWKAAIGNDESLWRRVVYVLNRGGRFQDFAKAYKGDLVAGHNAYGKQMNLYQEKTATTINTMTGKPFTGYADYIPPGLSSIGEEIVMQATI